MRAKLLTLVQVALIACLAILITQHSDAQSRTSTGESESANYSLEGRTEAVLIDGRPVLRILGKKGSSTEVKLKDRDNETAFVFDVTKFPNSTGKLYVTKSKVIYDPDGGKSRYYSVDRKDIKEVTFHKLLSGWSSARIDDGQDKKPFMVMWNMPAGGDKQSLHAANSFLIRVIKDFDAALLEFNKLTASVLQNENDEEVTEDEGEPEIISKYDRFKDVTIVGTSKMAVRGPKRGIRVFAEYSFPGKIQKRPESISLSFFASASRPVFREDNLELNFLIDGKRIPGGLMRLSDEEKTKSAIRQTILISMPASTFWEITKGRVVEFQIGTLEFKFSDVHLETFRNLLKYRVQE